MEAEERYGAGGFQCKYSSCLDGETAPFAIIVRASIAQAGHMGYIVLTLYFYSDVGNGHYEPLYVATHQQPQQANYGSTNYQ